MQKSKDELLKIADEALDADDDHFSAEADDQEKAWLVAQLSNWPTRVDEDCTTNMRFLMMSAAEIIRGSIQR
jgi:hypothetical protein